MTKTQAASPDHEGANPGALQIRSHLRAGSGPKRRWTAGNGVCLDLPLVVDYVAHSSAGVRVFSIEATVDCPGDHPVIAAMAFDAPQGMDTEALQREFRWRTPLDIVTQLVPRLIEQEIDPFTVELPLRGYPEAALGVQRGRHPLGDDFLRLIAEEYLRLGRGYAKRIALERNVSPRTVVSWVVKARERGILSAAPSPGAVGGHLMGPRNPSNGR